MFKRKSQLLAVPGITIVDNLVIYDPYMLTSQHVKTLYKGYKIIPVRRPFWGTYNKDKKEYNHESS